MSTSAPWLKNQIKLRCPDNQNEEYTASAGLYPGHLLELLSTGKVQKNTGSKATLVAYEDSLQGKTINDAYVADDVVFTTIPDKGDLLQLRVAAAAVAIVKGDKLFSAGDGTVAKQLDDAIQLYASTAASAAISNVATITAFDKSYTIPANTLKVGDVIKVTAQAIATATHSTDTLVLTLKIGSTTVIATAAVDVADNDIGLITANFVIRTIGASGTFVATGTQGLGVPGTATAKPWVKGSTTIDTTAAQAITVSATWSVADPGNSVRLDVLNVDLQRGSYTEAVAEAEEALDNSAGLAEAFVVARWL